MCYYFFIFIQIINTIIIIKHSESVPHGFLPRTTRGLKGQSDQTVSYVPYSVYTGLTLTANTILTCPTEPVLINTGQIEKKTKCH